MGNAEGSATAEPSASEARQMYSCVSLVLRRKSARLHLPLADRSLPFKLLRGSAVVVDGYDGSWIELQRRRERRMRREVLDLLFRLSGGAAGAEFHAMDLGVELGAWKSELYRILDWLNRHGYVQGWGLGPNVSLTEKGVAYLQGPGRAEQEIADEPEQGPPA